MRQWLLRSIASVLLFAFSTPALAQITFGPEFEFGAKRLWHIPWSHPMSLLTEGGVEPGEPEARAIEEFAAAVRGRCAGGGCIVEPLASHYGPQMPSYRVRFENGYYFDITADPWVVEIRAKPATLEELRAVRDVMQSHIFDVARSIGLSPTGTDMPMNRAAGHVNFGTTSAFGSDGRAYLDFFVDYANFSELAGGALGGDRVNAPGFDRLPAPLREKFFDVIRSLEANPQATPKSVAKALLEEIYTASGKQRSHHMQAFGLKRVKDLSKSKDQPSEFRAARMQESPDEFILWAEMIEARVAYRKAQPKAPILFANRPARSFSKTELVSAFYVYTEEAGLNFERFRSVLNHSLARTQPDSFITGHGRWTDPGYVEGALSHIERLATSIFVRERMLRALAHPNAADDLTGLPVLRKIVDRLQGLSERQSQEAVLLTGFMENVRKIPQWRPYFERELDRRLQEKIGGNLCRRVFQ